MLLEIFEDKEGSILMEYEEALERKENLIYKIGRARQYLRSLNANWEKWVPVEDVSLVQLRLWNFSDEIEIDINCKQMTGSDEDYPIEQKYIQNLLKDIKDNFGIVWDRKPTFNNYSKSFTWYGHNENLTFILLGAPQPPMCEIKKVVKTVTQEVYEAICPEDYNVD